MKENNLDSMNGVEIPDGWFKTKKAAIKAEKDKKDASKASSGGGGAGGGQMNASSIEVQEQMMMDEDESFLDMLAKQEMNFMATLESDEAPAWAPLQNPLPGITLAGHSDRSNMSVVGSDDGEFPSPPTLSNSEEIAQMVSESALDDISRASKRELIFESGARFDGMASGGTMARPNQPGNRAGCHPALWDLKWVRTATSTNAGSGSLNGEHAVRRVQECVPRVRHVRRQRQQAFRFQL